MHLSDDPNKCYKCAEGALSTSVCWSQKNSSVCLLYQHAGMCVSLCVCVQCQLICFSFQQVKHTCESSSCCFEEPEQGKRRQRKRNVLLTRFFLQPFSSPVSCLFCLLSSHSHLFFPNSLNYLCLLVLVCICLLLSLGQHYRWANKDARSTTSCTNMFFIGRLHSSNLERKVINMRQRAEDTGTDRQQPSGTCWPLSQISG